ncbi:outer membrane beta-barrel protein [Flavobacterium sp. DG2-3]|uniref:outer membrane beta-barrel protein n=1 Tax=Flavobacterium sp. DG2-3 TaxID=3068317 RepID=UPI00273D4BC2|nr:outer membrane beta-barrel protein [Flavobacterium sp. DG2-3]MDP5198460.1 outer membrane beta-barrel protein [Flavobacterium sp. DG2-3]
MNKRIFFFVAVFFAVLNIQAQVTAKPGLRAGFSFSTISEMHANYRTDFYAGGLVDIHLTKHYSLQPEINYTRQGSNDVARNYYDENTQTNRVEYLDLEINYLSLSAINKFTFGQGIQLQAGPTLDILLNDNLAVRKAQNDLGLVLGVAYALPSGLTFEARFKKGLLDVLSSDYYQNDSNNYYLFGDYNTNVNFQLGVSYSFGK